MNLSRWLNLLLICILTSSGSPWRFALQSGHPVSPPSFLIRKLWLPICAIHVNQTSVPRFVHRCTCWPPSDLQNKQRGGKIQEAISPHATLESGSQSAGGAERPFFDSMCSRPGFLCLIFFLFNCTHSYIGKGEVKFLPSKWIAISPHLAPEGN